MSLNTSYKNVINGHKAFLVKFKDVDYYDDKMISLNNNKSKTFLKNNYTYIKFQGNYYTFSTSKAWANAPLKVWFHKVANILLLNESEINCVVEHYKNNDEKQRQSIPDFLNATVSNEVKKYYHSPFINNSYLSLMVAFI